MFQGASPGHLRLATQSRIGRPGARAWRAAAGRRFVPMQATSHQSVLEVRAKLTLLSDVYTAVHSCSDTARRNSDRTDWVRRQTLFSNHHVTNYHWHKDDTVLWQASIHGHTLEKDHNQVEHAPKCDLWLVATIAVPPNLRLQAEALQCSAAACDSRMCVCLRHTIGK